MSRFPRPLTPCRYAGSTIRGPGMPMRHRRSRALVGFAFSWRIHRTDCCYWVRKNSTSDFQGIRMAARSHCATAPPSLSRRARFLARIRTVDSRSRAAARLSWAGESVAPTCQSESTPTRSWSSARCIDSLRRASDELASDFLVPGTREDGSTALPCLEGLLANEVCCRRSAQAVSTQFYIPVGALEGIDPLGFPFGTGGIVFAYRSAQPIRLLVECCNPVNPVALRLERSLGQTESSAARIAGNLHALEKRVQIRRRRCAGRRVSVAEYSERWSFPFSRGPHRQFDHGDAGGYLQGHEFGGRPHDGPPGLAERHSNAAAAHEAVAGEMPFEPHVILAARHQCRRRLVAVAMREIEQGKTDEVRAPVRRDLGQPRAQFGDRFVGTQPHGEERLAHDVDRFLERRRIEMQTPCIVAGLIAPPALRVARGTRPAIGKADDEVRAMSKMSLSAGAPCETIGIQVPHARHDFLARPVRLRHPGSFRVTRIARA